MDVSMAPSSKMPPWARRLVALLLVGSAIALYLTYQGNALGRLRVGDEPRTVRIDATPGKPLVLWTEVEVRIDSHARVHTSRLPHILDYEIEVLRGDERVALLQCNPFDVNVFRWSSERSMKTRSYLGRIEGCTVEAPAGGLTIRARRAWRDRDPGFRFEKTILVIEQ
jgi:hypothetical protein